MNPSAFAACVGSLVLLGAGAALAHDPLVWQQCQPLLRPVFMQVAPPAPARAAAPPLPFRYIGRVVQDGKLEVLLLRGERHFRVGPGERLGAEYRVEQVSESEVVFTYLPLNIQQSLPL